jgi:hypothetical protein
MFIFLVVIVIIFAVGGMFLINNNSDIETKSGDTQNDSRDYFGIVNNMSKRTNNKNKKEEFNRNPHNQLDDMSAPTAKEKENKLVEFYRNTHNQLAPPPPTATTPTAATPTPPPAAPGTP